MTSRILTVLTFIFFLSACEQAPEYIHLQGYTMGTTYNVKAEDRGDAEALQKRIDERLKEINQLMSTYIDDSELSLFNHNQSLDCLPLSKDTLTVIQAAVDISESTQGKFDVTLAPLIELWGFDKKETNNAIPSQQEITALLAKIGFSKIAIENGCIKKGDEQLSINLSAIAKGYGVDEIARIVAESGHKNFLVEIGGEIVVKGVNPKGKAWTVAIESASTADRSIQRLLSLKDISVATSGDYRNYFEKDGKRYSHTIDPTTGYPIEHNLASVTVLHKQNMMADAIATAMMVMGPKASLEYAEKHQLPVFILVKNGEQFEEKYSSAFEPYLKD
ncbi:FAD:protein FMN transferase [Aliikangiella sp. G2MR2-5]|uniref:FAD:protein FMN transferase n=1 Tax=Aliikangiella sp. G2MR2-5 TaxID=2788943 RepID=UPI0018AB7EB3|nr:FAD:protein FMN transferase [Aliikangiella sp. G2MR2-5]